MSDFNSFVKEQMARPEVARQYHRLAPFYRLADQLILLRKKRGLTQQELAEKAQTTQAVVSRLENVSVRCSLETVVRLAEALDAVVEVRLKPTEELDRENDLVQPADEGCDEAKEEAQNKGAVYFGSATDKACQDLVWYSVDPLTGQVRSPKDARKKRVPEIA